MDCDLIVIGSGFGGSVCALRAAQAGIRVVILERGRRMTEEAYSDLAEGRAPWVHRADEPGLLELHHLPGLVSLTGSAVGGGSHVYTGVTIRAPAEIYTEDWPTAVRSRTLQSHYDRVEQMIAPTPIPHPLCRTRMLQDVGRRMGATVTVLPLAMNWSHEPEHHQNGTYPSTLRGQAATLLRGGSSARKRTLDQTYLAEAERIGVTVRPLHEVQQIVPLRHGYGVHFRALSDGQWRPGSMTTPRVVVAAGTLGTVRLLLKCRDSFKTLPLLSQSLGDRFFTNGDFGGLLVGARMGLAPDDGPPVTGWIDQWKDDRLYLMETGVLLRGFAWSFGIMGFDDSPGRITLDAHRRLVHAGRPLGGSLFHSARLARLRELADAAGARLLIPPDFVNRRMPVTVHPLGGAAIADSPDRGVCDPFGEVFGYPGLYIADGSLLPTPTGVAPSMTIAALAEHVAEHFTDNA